jgi:hypothetical protein
MKNGRSRLTELPQHSQPSTAFPFPPFVHHELPFLWGNWFTEGLPTETWQMRGHTRSTHSQILAWYSRGHGQLWKSMGGQGCTPIRLALGPALLQTKGHRQVRDRPSILSPGAQFGARPLEGEQRWGKGK